VSIHQRAFDSRGEQYISGQWAVASGRRSEGKNQQKQKEAAGRARRIERMRGCGRTEDFVTFFWGPTWGGHNSEFARSEFVIPSEILGRTWRMWERLLRIAPTRGRKKASTQWGDHAPAAAGL